MEIDRIAEDIKFLNQIGQTLNIDERLKLELALLKLTQSYKFDQLLFWGRIEGITSNYYIAIGINFKGNFEFPHKQFFYSTNQFVFNELRQINPQYGEKVDTFRQMFQGVPEKILIQVEGEGDGGDAVPPPDDPANLENQKPLDDNSDVEIVPPPKNFTELDRLSYTVLAIEFDCALTPIGAYRLTPTHELRYNDSFKGLSQVEASKLENYQHFKAPSVQEKKDLIARSDALFHFNFLDPIQLDQPQGLWSIQCDSSRNNFTVRSLSWPGFMGYHRANSRVFGYSFFGDGIKNVDLAFLL